MFREKEKKKRVPFTKYVRKSTIEYLTDDNTTSEIQKDCKDSNTCKIRMEWVSASLSPLLVFFSPLYQFLKCKINNPTFKQVL